MKPTGAERQEVFRLGDFPLRIEKPRGFELLWLVPQVRVHVDGVEQGHNLCVLRDLEAVQVHIPGGTHNTR